MTYKRVLTISGSDSAGATGIQADLKTFFAQQVYGVSVLTSIMAQNTVGVQGIYELPADFVALQLDSVLSDIGVDAVKIGILSSAETIITVAQKLAEYRLDKIVLDPDMAAKGGEPLLPPDAVDALIKHLLPMAFLVTPNISEAKVLAGMEILNRDDMVEAAHKICAMGAKNVLIKGVQLQGEAVDIFFDGNQAHQYTAPMVASKNTHGTGCTLSSAIAAELAKGHELPDAIRKSKQYVTKAIQHSFETGVGHGPLNHWV